MPKIQEKIETTLFFSSLNILNFYRHDFLMSYLLYKVHSSAVTYIYVLLEFALR